MSRETWIQEFYPTPADSVPENHAVEHSLRKWRGLLPENLERHDVSFRDFAHSSNAPLVSAGACALCFHYRHDWRRPRLECPDCPLAAISPCNDTDSLWSKAVQGDPADVRSLVTALHSCSDEPDAPDFLGWYSYKSGGLNPFYLLPDNRIRQGNCPRPGESYALDHIEKQGRLLSDFQRALNVARDRGLLPHPWPKHIPDDATLLATRVTPAPGRTWYHDGRIYLEGFQPCGISCSSPVLDPEKGVSYYAEALREVLQKGLWSPPEPEKPRPIAYLAGPMRGKRDFNFPDFDKAKKLLEAAGYDVINPADLDRQMHIRAETLDYATGTFKGDPTPIILRDLVAITSLQPDRGDVLALLPGWSSSTGAICEVALAEWKCLKSLFVDPCTGSVFSYTPSLTPRGRTDPYMEETNHA